MKSAYFKKKLVGQNTNISIYYMDKGILLRTKTLVILIRHYVRDLSGFFIVVVFKMAANSVCRVEQKDKIPVNILKSFLHGVRYVVFCT